MIILLYEVVMYGQPIINAIHTLKYFTDITLYIYDKCSSTPEPKVIISEEKDDYLLIN